MWIVPFGIMSYECISFIFFIENTITKTIDIIKNWLITIKIMTDS